MNYLVAIDDTDMPDTIGTGRLVQELCREVESFGWGVCSPISRHQLFVHEDIPYTSHNSSMCFEMSLKTDSKAVFIEFTGNFLEKKAAKGSDPGFCMAGLKPDLDMEELIAFGLKAKSEVFHKSDAYDIANKAEIHLSEHGGTGSGIIGAVAGIGLRLTGNDGRYRGWYHFGKPGDVVSAGSLCECDFVDHVTTKEGRILNPAETLIIGSKKTKTIRMNTNQVVLAYANENPFRKNYIRYRTMTKDEVRQY